MIIVNLITKRKGNVIRKPLSVGNFVYFVKDGLPHTGVVNSIGSETYTVEDVHGLFMDWDDDVMDIPKKYCIGTQEIFIPKFPSKEVVNAYKGMGEITLQYENFPKKQVLNYGVVDGFNELIPFIPNKMIFELVNGVRYQYKSFQKAGNLLVAPDHTVIPIWMHHQNNTDIESIVNNSLESSIPPPQVATEFQISRIYTIDNSIYSKYDNISKVPENHIQLVYKKENTPYQKISTEEMVEKLKTQNLIKYEIDHLVVGTDKTDE